MTKALRGQVTCTRSHSHLVMKIVSLSVVLSCTMPHYCVHLYPLPKAQDTCRWVGWKEKQQAPHIPPPIMQPLLKLVVSRLPWVSLQCYCLPGHDFEPLVLDSGVGTLTHTGLTIQWSRASGGWAGRIEGAAARMAFSWQLTLFWHWPTPSTPRRHSPNCSLPFCFHKEQICSSYRKQDVPLLLFTTQLRG